jgi:hypothetical protein
LGRFLVLAAVLCLWGCGGPRYFRLPIDLNQMRRVAVLPIENLTNEPTAGDKVRRMVMAQLLAQGRFDVIEPGAVDRAIRQARVANRYQPGPDEAKAIGESLGAQGLISGAVSEFSMTRAGGTLEAPEVALELFLQDVGTGRTVWSASEARSGLSFWVRHFGAEPLRVSEQARQTVGAMLATLLFKPTRQAFPVDPRFEQERLKRKQIEEARGSREKRFQLLEEGFRTSLGRQIRQKVAGVSRTADGVHLYCASDVFFDFGQVKLSTEGAEVASVVARVIQERTGSQQVEIAVFPAAAEASEEVQSRYNTLWELSAVRGAALVARFQKDGWDPARLKTSYTGGKRGGPWAEGVEITVHFPAAEGPERPERPGTDDASAVEGGT